MLKYGTHYLLTNQKVQKAILQYRVCLKVVIEKGYVQSFKIGSKFVYSG